jgi:hypothetical protein
MVDVLRDRRVVRSAVDVRPVHELAEVAEVRIERAVLLHEHHDRLHRNVVADGDSLPSDSAGIDPR